MRVGIAGLCAVLLLAAPAAMAWSAQTQALIIADAYQLVSPGLQAVLILYQEQLHAGVNAVNISGDEPGAIIRQTVRDAQSVREHIATPGGYSVAVQTMGRIAAAVSTVNHPIASVPGFRNRSFLLGDFDGYIDANIRHFQISLPASLADVPELSDLERFLRGALDKGANLSSLLESAYFEGGVQRRAASFAPTSVPFGVASLSYSAAVKDTAMVWLIIWQASGGSVEKAKLLAVTR